MSSFHLQPHASSIAGTSSQVHTQPKHTTAKFTQHHQLAIAMPDTPLLLPSTIFFQNKSSPHCQRIKGFSWQNMHVAFSSNALWCHIHAMCFLFSIYLIIWLWSSPLLVWFYASIMDNMTTKKCKYKGLNKSTRLHTHHSAKRQTKILKGNEQEWWVASHTKEWHGILQGKSHLSVMSQAPL